MSLILDLKYLFVDLFLGRFCWLLPIGLSTALGLRVTFSFCHLLFCRHHQVGCLRSWSLSHGLFRRSHGLLLDDFFFHVYSVVVLGVAAGSVFGAALAFGAGFGGQAGGLISSNLIFSMGIKFNALSYYCSLFIDFSFVCVG